MCTISGTHYLSCLLSEKEMSLIGNLHIRQNVQKQVRLSSSVVSYCSFSIPAQLTVVVMVVCEIYGGQRSSFIEFGALNVVPLVTMGDISC